MISLSDLAWQAGMFEGEGAIRITRPSGATLGALRVEMCNCDRSILDEFHATWGGTVRPHSTQPPRRPAWKWVAAGGDAEAFLLAVWPLLHTERYREKAVVGLDFQAQKVRGGGQHLGPDYRARQLEYFERMRVLNIRGVA